ncbi:DUF3891 family protein [Pedobacter mucosus]|uniref:DUF3891 family protein n=1 Tax=Pedobacter mucosus TaxID=2895286 RepID=UPI001EE46E71|nr:DUF3891 family protein [Pedobacter mucosus]UKT65752.1 DUF3891 family protein [Pedobacter mucosus]
MIVNYKKDGWEIVTQRSHGLLAAQICARWKITDQPQRWVETLIAVAEHDDVYNEFERDPLINSSGGPVDFKMTSFDKDASTKLIDMAVTKSSFIALMIAKHINFTHGDDSKAKPFLADLKKKENGWLKSAISSPAEVSEAYELLEFCDAFSLLICQEMIQPEQRSIEISSGPGGVSYSFTAKEENLIVTPWPFELPEFQVSFECRTLKQLSYSNNNEFRKMLRLAPVERKLLNICEK